MKKDDLTLVKNPNTPQMEIIRRKGRTLEHYKVGPNKAGGEGERLGTAFKLKSGEVIYVPEQKSSDEAP